MLLCTCLPSKKCIKGFEYSSINQAIKNDKFSLEENDLCLQVRHRYQGTIRVHVSASFQ